MSRLLLGAFRPVRSLTIGLHPHRTMASRPKAVIFDLGGVIASATDPILNDFESAADIPKGTVVGVIVEHRGKPTDYWGKLERGEMKVSEFENRFSSLLSDKLKRKVSAEGMMNGFVGASFQPRPEMLEAVQCIRAEGIKTALLTNNWIYDGARTMVPVEPGYFNVVTESCRVGLNKPDPRIYKLCLGELKVQPEDAVFLDDIGSNLKSAKELGIKTIKVDQNFQKALDELEGYLGFSLRGYAPGTIAVPEKLKLENLEKLGQYLNQILGTDSSELPLIRCFKHGQSNPTYFIVHGGQKVVLRKKPPGKLLPSAHAVDREYTIMKALGEQGIPVPRMISYNDDESLVGTPFYVMEYLQGRIFKDPKVPEVSTEERRHIYNAMNEVLAKIHGVDLKRAGLENYGKIDGNYMKRNLLRWKKQFEASKTHEIPSMSKLIDWLMERLPTHETSAIVHGDFRLDNLIIHPTEPRVVAVIDWELSTIGDPLSDLATNCGTYIFPEGLPVLPGISEESCLKLNIPTKNEYIDDYCRRLGIDRVENMDFYLAYICFRYAAILQGVYKRAKQGQASSTDSESVGQLASMMADFGWAVASSSSLKPTSSAGQTTGSVPPGGGQRNYSTSASSGDLLPISVSGLSQKAQEYHARVKTFIKDHIYKYEDEMVRHMKSVNCWSVPKFVEDLKAKAKEEGLWNLWVPRSIDPSGKYGAGLTNLEYAFIAEETGRCLLAPEVFNCSAPDTGNMEVLLRYGTDEQKETWLTPLMNGEIRSCFGMTEPNVASSDATNIQASIDRDGDFYVINGHKWWTSGAMDPRCKICIFMGKTDPNAAKHVQQSMILVPMNTDGVDIIRPLDVFGYQDPPYGHAEVKFTNVRVPVTNILLGEGRGFEIAQGRLGPGRIHHCMRLIGMAERALELMIERTTNRTAFGKLLAQQGTIQADLAKSRIEIEQARLLVLKAAHLMDTAGNKAAMGEIAMIKVVAPTVAGQVLDRAMQAFGGAGLNSDLPLAHMYAWARVLRLADGPDEVHVRALARLLLKNAMKAKL